MSRIVSFLRSRVRVTRSHHVYMNQMIQLRHFAGVPAYTKELGESVESNGINKSPIPSIETNQSEDSNSSQNQQGSYSHQRNGRFRFPIISIFIASFISVLGFRMINYMIAHPEDDWVV